eukprot:11189648-Alexandrium_andersonii.AAC.1
MSASLVGSEMCIRDRPRSVSTPAWRSLVIKSPSRTRLQQNSGAWAKWETCLLYTSDAADDM